MRAIHQLVAGFTHGDAISNQARALMRLFGSWGCRSGIFCETRRILPELRGQVRDARECAAECGPGDVAVLHLSVGSAVNEIFAQLPCKKAIIYHNITPAHYFKGVNEETARLLELGREQMKSLAALDAAVMADSRFNAAELETAGYRDVSVVPLLLDLPLPSGGRGGFFGDGKASLLFVGRCVPNKKLERVLYAFYFFQKYVKSDSRLVFAGSYAGAERYYFLLQSLVRKLALRNVIFTGSLPAAELEALYRSCSAFVCMSEHEGFCIPLLEGMSRGLPVLAYAAAAVPETMDGAGVLMREKRFDLASEMLAALCGDGALRAAVLAGQNARIERYRRLNPALKLRARLAPLLEG